VFRLILTFLMITVAAFVSAVSVVTAYLESTDMLVVTDVSDPDNPKIVRYYKLGSPAKKLLVEGRLIFVQYDKSIETLIVGDNGELNRYNKKEFSFEISSFDVKGNKIVISYDGTVYVADSEFNTLGSVSTKWKIKQMRFFRDNYVLLNFGDEGLGLLNLERPSDAKLVWRLEAKFETIVDVVVKDENAFVLCESGMLFVVNLDDPLHPKVVKYTYLPENASKGMIYDNYLVIFSPSRKVVVLDIADPFEPKLLYSKFLGPDSKDVDVVFGNLYVAKNSGVYVYNITKVGIGFVNYVPAMNVMTFAMKKISSPRKTPPGEILWSYSVSSEIRSSSILMNGKIYFASVNGSVFSLDENGKFLWSYRARFLITSSVVGLNGKVYFGSWDNYLYALNSEGDLMWRVKLEGDITRPVVIDGKRVFVGAEDGNFYAIEDGKIVWRKSVDGWITTNPVLFSDGRVVFGTSSGKVYAMSYSGNILWTFDAEGWISSGHRSTLFLSVAG
jgi:outer membrane protein assembly factor BamB